jgi:hypothetical protein
MRKLKGVKGDNFRHKKTADYLSSGGFNIMMDIWLYQHQHSTCEGEISMG